MSNAEMQHYANTYRSVVRRSLSKNAAVGGMDEDAVATHQTAILTSYGIVPANRILELGCGTGRIWRALSTTVDMAQCRYVGLDVVPNLVSTTEKRLNQLGMPKDHYDVRLASSLANYPQGFDAESLFAFSVFTHMEPEDIVATMTQLRKCASPSAKGLFTFLPLEYQFGRSMFEAEAQFAFDKRFDRVRNTAMTQDMAVRLMELGGWEVTGAYWAELPEPFDANGNALTNQSWLVVTPKGTPA